MKRIQTSIQVLDYAELSTYFLPDERVVKIARQNCNITTLFEAVRAIVSFCEDFINGATARNFAISSREVLLAVCYTQILLRRHGERAMSTSTTRETKMIMKTAMRN